MSNQEILAQLTDFRQRVLHADKLRRDGDKEGADKLMPTKEELIQAIKAYRQSLGAKQSARAATSESKSRAAAIASMDNLADLFKK